jgi:hypothetical protein
VAILLEKAGIVTMRRNTFGGGTASQSDTLKEETETVSVMIANKTSNNVIRTWYPTAVTVEATHCTATVTVAAPTSVTSPATIPAVPVEIEVYWTSTFKANVFLGNYTGVTTSGQQLTFEVPFQAVNLTDGSLSGSIRVQTHSTADYDGSGTLTTASSQFSRMIALTGSCDLTPGIEVVKRAWTGVTDANADYDTVVATGTEIPVDETLRRGTQVWFTYEVANTGFGDITDVVVTDSVLGEVCVIPEIPRESVAVCAAPGVIYPNSGGGS